MPYDEGLAERIRHLMATRGDVVEKKMFGGIAFMVGERMAVGVVKDDLMVRVGPDAHDAALAQPHARPMDMGGRVSRGFVYVAPEGVATRRRPRRLGRPWGELRDDGGPSQATPTNLRCRLRRRADGAAALPRPLTRGAQRS